MHQQAEKRVAEDATRTIAHFGVTSPQVMLHSIRMHTNFLSISLQARSSLASLSLTKAGNMLSRELSVTAETTLKSNVRALFESMPKHSAYRAELTGRLAANLPAPLNATNSSARYTRKQISLVRRGDTSVSQQARPHAACHTRAISRSVGFQKRSTCRPSERPQGQSPRNPK
jgi:hypothetical protein